MVELVMISGEALARTSEADLQRAEKQHLLGKEVLRDFVLSFRISQGYEGLQENLFKLLGAYYRLVLPGEDLALVRSMAPGLRHRVLEFQVPRHHKPIKAATFRAGLLLRKHVMFTSEQIKSSTFGLAWDDFNQMGLQPTGSIPVSTLIQDTEFKMLKQDAYWVKKGRPNPPAGADPHQSFVRTHLVLGNPTNSAAFDSIFATIEDHHQILNTHPAEWHQLARVWERRHRGESFFPPVPGDPNSLAA